jgi:hypothetical protein
VQRLKEMKSENAYAKLKKLSVLSGNAWPRSNAMKDGLRKKQKKRPVRHNACAKLRKNSG